LGVLALERRVEEPEVAIGLVTLGGRLVGLGIRAWDAIRHGH